MPKSKRARLVHTSAVQKQPSKARAATLYAAVQAAAAAHPHTYVFAVHHMRNTHLKAVRHRFAPDGRLFFGKTKVMAKALGGSAAEAAAPGLHALTPFVRGSVGLLCTHAAPAAVRERLEEAVASDYARAGAVAPRGFVVPAGVVYSRGGEAAVEDDVPLPHSLEVVVRKCGMPTRLERGRVVLDQAYVVCEAGQVLESRQTALLKVFGVALAEFRVRLVACWSAGTQEVTLLEGEDEDDGGMEV